MSKTEGLSKTEEDLLPKFEEDLLPKFEEPELELEPDLPVKKGSVSKTEGLPKPELAVLLPKLEERTGSENTDPGAVFSTTSLPNTSVRREMVEPSGLVVILVPMMSV